MNWIAARQSKGLEIFKVDGNEITSNKPSIAPNAIRVFAFSRDGEQIALADGVNLDILSFPKCEILFKYPMPKCSKIFYSPLSSVVVAYENFHKTEEQPEGIDNIVLIDSRNFNVISRYKQPILNNWQPIWTADERMCIRVHNGEIFFFKNNIFDTSVSKLSIKKLSSASISLYKDEIYVSVYVPAVNTGMASVRVFQYDSETNRINKDKPVTLRSFSSVDSANILWSASGSELLVVTSCDVSKESYYGEQCLFYLSITDPCSNCIVPLVKRGPIYSVKWNPKANNRFFVVNHGFMPSVVAVYNHKCEVVHNFGESPRNSLSFNPQGSLLCVCGFEGLKGDVDVYDFQKRTKITQIRVPNTSLLTWSDDGCHFLTATISPRLRVDNGFRLWHFTGVLLCRREFAGESGAAGELYQIEFLPQSTISQPNILYKKWDGNIINLIDSKSPANIGDSSRLINNSDHVVKFTAKVEAESVYLPPHLRKNKPSGSENGRPKMQSVKSDSINHPVDEKEKSIKAIKKKLEAIQKLKEKRADGEKLELNQLTKIDSESSLLEELQRLTL